MRACPLLLLLLACSDGEEPVDTEPVEAVPPAGPDILLVTIDTLRADRVGAYGDPLAQTPAMDGLAAEGALFRQAHAVTPLTLPSHASLLTGLYPVHHGLRDNAGFRLAPEVPTLAEALQGGGYQTAAFVSAFVLDSAWGLDQGFVVYRDPFHPEEVAASGAFGEVELPAAEVVNAARAWWRQAEGQGPRFAWVHLYDPHTPWRARPDWEGDPYRGEVAYADGEVGKLLAEVGPDTLVALTSDHGEGLWTEGEREHGVLLNPHITRVPFLLRPPGGLSGAEAPAPPETAPVLASGEAAWPLQRPEGADPDLVLDPVPDAPRAARVVDTPVSGVDLAPTLADYAGVELPQVDGRSLRAAVDGGPGASLPVLPVYAETWFPWFHLGWSSLHAVQDDQHRLEVGGRTEQIALQPAAREAAPAPALEEALTRLKGALDPRPGEVDETTAAALQALGYLTESSPQPAAGAAASQERPDPRDRVGVLAELQAASQLAPLGRLRALEDLLIREPDMADAAIERANTLAELGELDAAWEATEEILARWPDHPLALNNAGVLARQRGELDVALQLAERMRTLNPADARAWRLEAAVRVDQEDAAGVIEATKAGLAVAPEDPNLHYLRALAEVQVGDPALALVHLEAARNSGSRAGDIDLWLGVAHERSGDIDAAVKAYDTATRTMPGDARPWAMAGWMLYQADRCEEALPFLVNVARRGAANDPQIRQALSACQQQQQQRQGAGQTPGILPGG